ncbi:MAG: AAA family ATPase [Pirellulaceae bacterium]
MYETYFRLQRRPFSTVPTPDDYFPADSIENARLALIRQVERYEGPAIVVGPVGSGKSLLCQLVADHFRSSCRVALVPNGRITSRKSLIQVILFELGLPYRGADEAEMRLTLTEHVSNRSLCPNGVLLLMDEADQLPMAILDELRTLTNLVNAGQPAIRIVLFGSPRLEERFTSPRLESFSQRLVGRFYLEPFDREETMDYVVTHLEDCGGDPGQLCTPDALEGIYCATNGVPRLINQLCNHAMVLAAVNGYRQLTANVINEAWSDLQQLPLPAAMQMQHPILRIDTQTQEDDEFGEAFATESDETAEAETLQHPNPMERLDEIQQGLNLIHGGTEDSDEESYFAEFDYSNSTRFAPEDSANDSFTDDSESTTFAPSQTESLPVEKPQYVAESDSNLGAETPAATADEDDSTPVRLRVHRAPNPFDEEFAEVEVVVDRYVTADTLARRANRTVIAGNSLHLAGKLQQNLPDAAHSEVADTETNADSDATANVLPPPFMGRETDASTLYEDIPVDNELAASSTQHADIPAESELPQSSSQHEAADADQETQPLAADSIWNSFADNDYTVTVDSDSVDYFTQLAQQMTASVQLRLHSETATDNQVPQSNDASEPEPASRDTQQAVPQFKPPGDRDVVDVPLTPLDVEFQGDHQSELEVADEALGPHDDNGTNPPTLDDSSYSPEPESGQVEVTNAKPVENNSASVQFPAAPPVDVQRKLRPRKYRTLFSRLRSG